MDLYRSFRKSDSIFSFLYAKRENSLDKTTKIAHMCATFVCDENSSVACLHDVKRKLSWEFEKTGGTPKKNKDFYAFTIGKRGSHS